MCVGRDRHWDNWSGFNAKMEVLFQKPCSGSRPTTGEYDLK